MVFMRHEIKARSVASLSLGEFQAALVDKPLEMAPVLADKGDGIFVETIEVHGAHERGVGCALRFLKRSPPQCVQVTILSAAISFRQNLTSKSKETHRAFFHLGARRVVFTHEEHVVAWRDHGIAGAQEI